MTRPLNMNRGPRKRQLRWLAEHPGSGRCKKCGRWAWLLQSICGLCWQQVEVAS